MLRVKDVDLERLQLAVQFGKGGKSRLTMIPPKLEPALRAHRERLRVLHAKDREANLPGVELPEALERKWPKAGEKFVWFWFWPSRNLMRDHRSGVVRRHHVLDVTFQKAIREAELAVARVQARVSQGGHNVPVAIIRRRFDSGLRNFHDTYRRLVSSWALYDNAGPVPIQTASGDNP